MTAAWKKLRFILSVRSDFHIIDSLLIAVHAFVNLVIYIDIDILLTLISTLFPKDFGQSLRQASSSKGVF